MNSTVLWSRHVPSTAEGNSEDKKMHKDNLQGQIIKLYHNLRHQMETKIWLHSHPFRLGIWLDVWLFHFQLFLLRFFFLRLIVLLFLFLFRLHFLHTQMTVMLQKHHTIATKYISLCIMVLKEHKEQNSFAKRTWKQNSYTPTHII